MKKPLYPQREDVVRAWILMNLSKEGQPDYEDNFWAFSFVNDLTSDYPDEAFIVIRAILALDASNRVLQVLAAGPVEDLLVKHGPDLIGKVEVEAHRDPAFRKLLGGVWKSGIDSEVWRRVEGVWDRRGWDGIPE
jgi:hypothetical protein